MFINWNAISELLYIRDTTIPLQLSRMSSVLAHLSDNTVEILWTNGGHTLGTILTLLVKCFGEEK